MLHDNVLSLLRGRGGQVRSYADAKAAHAAAEALCALLPGCSGDLQGRSAANIVWAISAIGVASEAAARALDAALRAFGRALGDASAAELATVASALARLWEQAR
jgi:hypothetical protein